MIKKKRELEERKKFPLEMKLKQKIIGQENAIKVVSSGNIINKHKIYFCDSK